MTGALALLSVGDQSASYPLSFEPKASFKPKQPKPLLARPNVAVAPQPPEPPQVPSPTLPTLTSSSRMLRSNRLEV